MMGMGLGKKVQKKKLSVCKKSRNRGRRRVSCRRGTDGRTVGLRGCRDVGGRGKGAKSERATSELKSVRFAVMYSAVAVSV